MRRMLCKLSDLVFRYSVLQQVTANEEEQEQCGRAHSFTLRQQCGEFALVTQREFTILQPHKTAQLLLHLQTTAEMLSRHKHANLPVCMLVLRLANTCNLFHHNNICKSSTQEGMRARGNTCKWHQPGMLCTDSGAFRWQI